MRCSASADNGDGDCRGAEPWRSSLARAAPPCVGRWFRQRLAALDADLGRAIVTLVESRGATSVRTVPPAELSSYGNHSVIIVTPVRSLKRIAGVQLVPIGSGRALISLEHSHSISQFELGVRDALERGGVTGVERQTLGKIADILRHTRRARGIAVAGRTIIVLESKRQRRRSASGAG